MLVGYKQVVLLLFFLFRTLSFKCFGIEYNESRVCNSHGVCIEEDTCVCRSGYYHEDCSKWNCFGIDKNKPCNSHGICTEPDICSCYGGYFGKDCDKWDCSIVSPFFESESDELECSGNGECLENGKCNCYEGYYSEKCDVWKCGKFFSNQTEVCNNHGICSSPNLCICEFDMYKGKECQGFQINDVIRTFVLLMVIGYSFGMIFVQIQEMDLIKAKNVMQGVTSGDLSLKKNKRFIRIVIENDEVRLKLDNFYDYEMNKKKEKKTDEEANKANKMESNTLDLVKETKNTDYTSTIEKETTVVVPKIDFDRKITGTIKKEETKDEFQERVSDVDENKIVEETKKVKKVEEVHASVIIKNPEVSSEIKDSFPLSKKEKEELKTNGVNGILKKENPQKEIQQIERKVDSNLSKKDSEIPPSVSINKTQNEETKSSETFSFKSLINKDDEVIKAVDLEKFLESEEGKKEGSNVLYEEIFENEVIEEVCGIRNIEPICPPNSPERNVEKIDILGKDLPWFGYWKDVCQGNIKF